MAFLQEGSKQEKVPWNWWLYQLKKDEGEIFPIDYFDGAFIDAMGLPSSTLFALFEAIVDMNNDSLLDILIGNWVQNKQWLLFSFCQK